MIKLTRDEISAVLNAYIRSGLKDDQDVQAFNAALNATLISRPRTPRSIAANTHNVVVIATDGSMWATRDGVTWLAMGPLPAPEDAR